MNTNTFNSNNSILDKDLFKYKFIDVSKLKSDLFMNGLSDNFVSDFVSTVEYDFGELEKLFSNCTSSDQYKFSWEKLRRELKIQLLFLNNLYDDCHTNEKLRNLSKSVCSTLGGRYISKLLFLNFWDKFFAQYREPCIRNIGYFKFTLGLNDKFRSRTTTIIMEFLEIKETNFKTLSDLLEDKNISTPLVLKSNWMVLLKLFQLLVDDQYLIGIQKAVLAKWICHYFRKRGKNGELISVKEGYARKKLSHEVENPKMGKSVDKFKLKLDGKG